MHGSGIDALTLISHTERVRNYESNSPPPLASSANGCALFEEIIRVSRPPQRPSGLRRHVFAEDAPCSV
jgi:hypothetical protein